MPQQKKIILLSISLLITACATASAIALARPPEFPEERNYTPADKGYTQYGAPSMHGTHQLALTFDDGPSPVTTPKILDILTKYGVHATFFIVGANITPATKPIVERMLREGHTIASHDFVHDNNNLVTQTHFHDNVLKSILGLRAVLKSAGVEQKEMYFRYPYAAYDEVKSSISPYEHMNALRELSYEIYGENCINFVFWNIDSNDWDPAMTPGEITQNIIANMEGGTALTYTVIHGASGHISYGKKSVQITKPDNGGVVLMHDIHQREVDALPMTLDYALKAGIAIVPLSAVKEYSYDGKTCEPKNSD